MNFKSLITLFALDLGTTYRWPLVLLVFVRSSSYIHLLKFCGPAL